MTGWFRAETALLAERSPGHPATREAWEAQRPQMRSDLFEMLGLAPLPTRTDLKASITGTNETELVRVENLHFQSLPGLYVTANLYLPKKNPNRAPTILYLCGHGPVVTNGISYGNKVAYQHHGAWFARNGYVCLILDTVQLGEIQGVHHGTYREGMWWWNSRGYTPAGVEAWNSIRALDYLATRPEVDMERIGVTGRSGGGAYSWWVAALDDRVKVAAPVAGITDLENHVVDGTVSGHCDCMFIVNTHRWDYPAVAALVAPRPLLLVNTDHDHIFPLSGVMRTHAKVRGVYELYGAAERLGLVIGPGPHKDTQDLQVPVFRWFNHFLKSDDRPVEMAATKFFSPEQLRVFKDLPSDQVNTTIHRTFIPATGAPKVPELEVDWLMAREDWMTHLRRKTFAGWPTNVPGLEMELVASTTKDGMRFQAYDFKAQSDLTLRFYLLQPERGRVARMVVHVLDDEPGEAPPDPEGAWSYRAWLATMRPGFSRELIAELAGQPEGKPEPVTAYVALKQSVAESKVAHAWVAPRGIGLTAWPGDAKQQINFRRRFMLLGQTLAGMQAWDIRRGLQAARATQAGRTVPPILQARGGLAAGAVYANLFETEPAPLELWQLPANHQSGPDLLNILRALDLPQALAIAVERGPVRLHAPQPGVADYASAVLTARGWPKENLVIETAQQ